MISPSNPPKGWITEEIIFEKLYCGRWCYENWTDVIIEGSYEIIDNNKVKIISNISAPDSENKKCFKIEDTSYEENICIY